MKKSFVLVAAIVAVVGLGAVAAVAKENVKVETSVSLEYRPGGDGHPAFQGEVKAKKKGCEKGRTVRLRDDTVGDLIDSDRTNDRGRYSIIFAHAEPGVPYVAQARQKKITKDNGDTIVCRPGSSDRIHIKVHP